MTRKIIQKNKVKINRELKWYTGKYLTQKKSVKEEEKQKRCKTYRKENKMVVINPTSWGLSHILTVYGIKQSKQRADLQNGIKIHDPITGCLQWALFTY